jgi:hypothetical protein
MALPKLEIPVYTLNLPSTDEEVKYRPFLVKEQKRMMMAQESKDTTEIVDAVNQLISDCTFNKVDTKKIAMFDAEYIFLKLRSKSVGEKAEVQVICKDDNKTKVSVTVNLEDVECNMTNEHTNVVEITDTVKIVFGYPLLESFRHVDNKDTTKALFEMIISCIEEIHYGEDIYNKVDTSKKELTEFIDSLDINQFKKVSDFFETMPKLRHAVEVINPETKVKNEIVIEGLQSFLV